MSGAESNKLKFVILTLTPPGEDLCGFKESAKLLLIARCMGTTAEANGITKPITNASIVALAVGNKLGLNPSSSVNSSENTPYSIGTITTNAHAMDGNTNRLACNKIIPEKPALERPYMRIIPFSNAFVSIVIISKE